MEQVTENVFTSTKIRGCNPSFVVTSVGVVVVDTPQLPSKAVQMRREAESRGAIRYLINTEHHVDHIFGNYYFKGAGTVAQHQGVYDNFMVATPDLDPFAYAAEAVPTDDPDGASLFPDRDEYYADPNKGELVFNGQWVASLEVVAGLDVDHVVPGHGPVTTKKYLATQRAVLLDWLSAVATAVAKGWSREETISRVNFAERYPVDIGQGYMMDHIQTLNAASLWDKMTAPPAGAVR